MKHWIKSRLADVGLHGYTHDSLPTGVHWLHDISRQGVLGPRPLCFDVGANVGQTVVDLRRLWPAAQVHAFEPFAAPFAQLAALGTRLGSGIVPRPFAMGAVPGEVEVVPHADSVQTSLRRTEAPGPGRPAERIRIDTIDAYCRAEGISQIDILKTDTEGYDLEVLRGARGLLDERRVGFVYAEVTFEARDPQHSAFQPIFQELSARGYRFLGLYETYPMHHFPEPNLFCNALFMAGHLFRKPS